VSKNTYIIVSNPSLQHTPFLIQELAKTPNTNIVFCTAFFLPANWLIKTILPSTFYSKLVKPSLQAVSILPNVQIKTNWKAMCFVLFGKWQYSLAEERVFKQDTIHDKWVSKFVQQKKITCFIGYEKSCVNTLKQLPNVCKKILDLAQVHPNFIQNLRTSFSFFKESTGSDNLFNTISSKKKIEYDCVDEIWTISSFARNTFFSTNVSTHKIKQHTLGVNKTVFTPKALNCSSNNSTLNLIYIGICHARKGLHILFQALENLHIKGVNCCLTIIGPEGNATAVLKKKKIPNVFFINAVSQKEVVNYLHKADVFVFPSFLDSWGMAVIEAMSCGLPVIVTENCGAAALVTIDCGFVIPINNIEALENKILFFYNNPDAKISMGNQAVKAVSKITWDAYGKSVENSVFYD
jgi:alpha-maltose-1-phosphate synthase